MRAATLNQGEIITGIAALLSGGGLWTWLAARGNIKRDLIGIVQKAAGDMVLELRVEIGDIRKRCETLERENESLKQANHRLWRENLQLQQHINSLSHVMVTANLSVPAYPKIGREYWQNDADGNLEPKLVDDTQ